jgi:hypothetical protein
VIGGNSNKFSIHCVCKFVALLIAILVESFLVDQYSQGSTGQSTRYLELFSTTAETVINFILSTSACHLPVSEVDRGFPLLLAGERGGRLLCKNEFFIVKSGALVWCPTNFQHARLKFYVDDSCNKFTRLLGSSVTLFTLLSEKMLTTEETNVSTGTSRVYRIRAEKP